MTLRSHKGVTTSSRKATQSSQKPTPTLKNCLLLGSQRHVRDTKGERARDQVPRPRPSIRNPAAQPLRRRASCEGWGGRGSQSRAATARGERSRPWERFGERSRGFPVDRLRRPQPTPPHPVATSALLTPRAALPVGRHGEATGRGDLREGQEVRSARVKGPEGGGRGGPRHRGEQPPGSAAILGSQGRPRVGLRRPVGRRGRGAPGTRARRTWWSPERGRYRRSARSSGCGARSGSGCSYPGWRAK